MIKTCWDCEYFRDTDDEEQCFGDVPDSHDFNGLTTCSAFKWIDHRLAAAERAEECLCGVRDEGAKK